MSILLITLVDGRIRPIVIELARAELDNQVTGQVNKICTELAESGALTYSDIVTLSYDNSGTLTGMVTNMDTINNLRITIGREVSEVLDGMDRSRVQVPIGAVLNLNVLTGLGPEVSVEILHAGQVGIRFQNEFQEAGINQTLHQIDMIVSVEVLLMVPGGVYNQQLSCTVPLAESILLGTVPESYTNFEQFDSASDSNAAEE